MSKASDLADMAADPGKRVPDQTDNEGRFLTTDGTDTSWAEITRPVSVVTSTRTIAKADHSKIIDITSGTFTVTFSAVATLEAGFFCFIRNQGTGDVTLATNGSETIDGLETFIMYPGEVRMFQCDGSVIRSIVYGGFYRVFDGTGTTTFNKPPGYISFNVEVIGGGGGGGSHSIYGGAGGGGGGYNTMILSNDLVGSSETCTVGAGGNGGNGGDGVNGGDTNFAYVKASGGRYGGNGYSGGGYGGSLQTGSGSTPYPLTTASTAIYGGFIGAMRKSEVYPPSGYSSIWGGGAGGGGGTTSTCYGGSGGQSNLGGGGGGGGGCNTAGYTGAGAGGSSVCGGNGGSGGSGSSSSVGTVGSPGVAPGGGGGGGGAGSSSSLGGDGGDGCIRIRGLI